MRKKGVVFFAPASARARATASCSAARHDASGSSPSVGSRLAFRTRELAAYAGRQFIEEWADFMFKPRTGEELNGKSEAAKTTIDFNNNEDE